MEKICRKNGCLVVLPGSHQGKFYNHEYPKWKNGVNKMYYGAKIDMSIQNDLVYLEMNKGDTVFFHPLLIHGSGANKTEGFRKAISCHYASSECNYIDVDGTIQETFKKEVESIANKKLNLSKQEKLSLTDIWRLKSRLVTGKKVNL
jgi:phytanoyl-CoA hydroxylase